LITDGVDVLYAVAVSPVSNAIVHHRVATSASNTKRHKVIWDDLEKSVSCCISFFW